MKKIIFLSIGLFSSSIQAQSFSQVDITLAAAALAQNSELMGTCRALYQQGLTTEQIAEQLVLSNKICLQELQDCRFEPMGSDPSLLGFFAFPFALMVVVYVGMVISSCCEELLKEEK